MLHQGSICIPIRFEGLLAEGGQHVEEPAVLSLNQGIIDRITLYIAGGIGGVSVLPAGKPYHHHLETVLACVAYHMVNGCKIVMAFLILDHIP